MSTPPEKASLPAHFEAALQSAEKSRDVSELAQLFAEKSQLTNLGGDHTDDAHEFWSVYLAQFESIKSTFSSRTIGDSSAALEWTLTGTRIGGEPIEYCGISVLDWEGDKVTKFRTYYDSAAFVKNPAKG